MTLEMTYAATVLADRRREFAGAHAHTVQRAVAELSAARRSARAERARRRLARRPAVAGALRPAVQSARGR